MDPPISSVPDAGLKASGAKVHGVLWDVSDRDSVQRAANETLAIFGKVHVVCNNAGVGVGGQFEAIAPNDWESGHRSKPHGRHPRDSGLPAARQGAWRGRSHHQHCIVGRARLCPPGTAPYNASKFGVIALSETLAAELAGTAIGVSVPCTSFVRTRIATSARNRPPRFGGPLNQPSTAPMHNGQHSWTRDGSRKRLRAA
ncbi:NAD(P)-dependent dehydrogenase (short-subunit alcohol dehydrogenase family) [Bradyrhizobium sp. AZCC 1721]